MSEKVSIQSITTGPRKTNFEVLRILSMCMVLGLHMNFKHIGILDIAVYGYKSVFIQTLIESLCLPAVNIFILISGWFSIKASLRGFVTFVFQYVFIVTLTYTIFLFYSKGHVNIFELFSCLGFSKYGWFFVCYMILYIISPFINHYLDQLSRESFTRLLIILFTIMIIFGWIGGNINFNNGYSSISFILIYILGRYLFLYKKKCERPWFLIFLMVSLLNTIIIYLDIYIFSSKGISRLLSYENPIILIQAVTLVMFFNNVRINTNAYINYVARSSFAVYLIHDCASFQISSFGAIVKWLFFQFEGVELILCMLGLIFSAFVFAIILDFFRKKAWEYISRFIFKRIPNYNFY